MKTYTFTLRSRTYTFRAESLALAKGMLKQRMREDGLV